MPLSLKWIILIVPYVYQHVISNLLATLTNATASVKLNNQMYIIIIKLLITGWQ